MVRGAALIRELAENVRAFKAASGIERLIGFGSQARGTATAGSDVDFLLVDDRFESVVFLRRALGLRKFWPERLPVDFLCYTPSEFDDLRRRPTLVRSAVEEGIIA